MDGVDTKTHAAGPIPPASAAVDYTGTDLPAPGYSTPFYGRTFRPSERAIAASFPGTDAPLPAQLAEHMTPGDPDERRGRQTQQATDRALEAQPQGHLMSWQRPAFNQQQPPVRARGGWTGDDPARPAQTYRNLFSRAFDQWAAQTLGIKQMMAAPMANIPPAQRDDAPGALPVANSARGNRVAGVGPQPNTFRIIPRAWDTNLTVADSAAGASAAAAAQTRSGWRAR